MKNKTCNSEIISLLKHSTTNLALVDLMSEVKVPSSLSLLNLSRRLSIGTEINTLLLEYIILRSFNNRYNIQLYRTRL